LHDLRDFAPLDDPVTREADPSGPVVAEAAPPALSLVIPFHDEADNVGPLLREVAAALHGRMSFEVVLVDDGSRDGTGTRLREAAVHLPGQVEIVRHPTRRGQSAALCAGIRRATAPWVVTLDGDGQNDPSDIEKLLAVLRDEGTPSTVALVCGHRRRRHDSWLKRLSSKVANAVRGDLLGDGIADTGCGLKLIERRAFLALPAFDHMHRFLPALMQRAGRDVIAVEVSHRPRRHGRSKYGVHNRLWVGIVDLIGVMWLQRRSLVIADEPALRNEANESSICSMSCDADRGTRAFNEVMERGQRQ
jgi:dolichol-phosphate mannosyltransferase